MLVCGYIRIYLAVYGPEIIGGFSLEENSQKTKAVGGLGRTNYGGLRNLRTPMIDPLNTTAVVIELFLTTTQDCI